MQLPNIFLIGPMGAGKTSIGKLLARELHMDFYDSDQEIEARCGVDVAWIFDVEGPEGFRAREEAVVADLTQKKRIVLATGGGTVESPISRGLLAGRGSVIYLKATIEQQLERTARDRKRPYIQGSDNVEETLEMLRARREPLYEELADWVIETDNQSVRAVVNAIMKKIQVNPYQSEEDFL